ncbi:MAG: hypothetical protein ACT4QC_00370 [Planctomycetaceae bacterium]
MPTSLDLRLAALRSRLRQVLLTYGLSWTAAALVAAILLVCLADWLFHLDDGGVRLILGLGVLGIGAWVAWRQLVGPLRLRLTDTDLAQRLEERYPGFQDSLVSSVQFAAAESDARLGSPDLQRAVVRQALARLEAAGGGDLIQARPARRALAAVAAVCAAAVLVALLDRSQAAIALRRLVRPFAGPTWPKQIELRLLDGELRPLAGAGDEPVEVVRGEPFKVYAENLAGRLPAKVVLETRRSADAGLAEVMRPLSLNDAAGSPRELALGQLPTTRGDIEFRASGGDDATVWRRLCIVPPPAVEALQVTLAPPSYLGHSALRQPEQSGHVQGYVGTTVEIVATVNKPVARAVLRLKDEEIHPVRISGDGRQLAADFMIAEPGVYSWWLELTDELGFTNNDPTRYEVRGIADLEPDVRIDLPASDLLVTADAQVAVRATAKDDLGLKEVRLAYEPFEPGADVRLPAPRDIASGRASTKLVPLFDGAGRPLEQPVDYLWDLGELQPVPGSRIAFRVEATDDFDLSELFAGGPAGDVSGENSDPRGQDPPETAAAMRTPARLPGEAPPRHLGVSVTRVLTVVTKKEKRNELAQQQAGLLQELERTVKLQKQARDQVHDLQLQLRNTQTLRPEDRDALHRTEIGQREVAAQLSQPALGVRSRASRLLDELRNNAIDDPVMKERLSDVALELSRLQEGALPRVEQALTQARKLAQTAAAASQNRDAAATEGALEQAATNQQEVLETLAELVQDLARWHSEHDAARELEELARQQGELNRQTSEVAQRTLTKPRDRLSPQDQADLEKLTARQQRQAEQLEQLQSQINDRLEALSGSNPDASIALQEVLDEMREQAVAEQMREAASQVSENRMGEAGVSQTEVLQKLRDIENTLTNRHQVDSEMLVKRMKKAEGELARLAERQADLLQKARAAEAIADAAERQAELERLRREQQQLQEDASGVVRRLTRWQAQRPSNSSQRALGQMQQAQEELAAGDEQEAALRQQEALDDLEQAQRELARERRKAEERLAREQLEKIADQLQAMVGRQQAVIDETVRLDQIWRASNRFTRGQLATLRDLATTERSLQEDTDQLVEKLTAAEVFSMTLRGASRHMLRAAQLLSDRQTGHETVQAAESARRRYLELGEAIRQGNERKPASQRQQPQGEGGGDGESGPEGDIIAAISQLKMVLSLQREALERTAFLEQVRAASGTLTPEQQQELELLAREQSDLANLARNLSELVSPTDDEEEDESDMEAESGPSIHRELVE